VYTVLVRGVYRLYSPVEAIAWISLFGLAAMSPTAAVSRPETQAHPLVLALVAYVATVPPGKGGIALMTVHYELDQKSDVYVDSECAKDLGRIWLTISARYGWPA
jgi:hypothetical protein